MKRLRKVNRSIGKRFMSASVILISSMILVSYLFSGWYMVHSTEGKLLEDYQDVREFTIRQIVRYQNDLARFTTLLASDEELQKLLAGQGAANAAQKVKSSVAICRILRNYELLRSDCVCVELLLADGGVYTSDSSNKNSFHAVGDISWLESLDWNMSRFFFRGPDLVCRNVFYDDIITYSCNVGNYYTNQQRSGRLFIHIRREAFESLVFETDMESSWCAILNAQGEVLAEAGEKKAGKEQYQELLSEREEKKGIISDRDGWYLYDNQSDCGLSLVMYMPKDRLYNEERNIFLFFCLLFFVCLFCACLIMYVISRRLSKPIVALSNAARQISEGKLDVHLHSDTGDEIGTLTESFNQMTDSLEQQMRDLQKAERIRSDLQMSILMAQINPHFIYNTLNSAIYLSRVGAARKAERLLQLFIRILQNNMKSGIDGVITTIGEDIEDLKGYIELQEIRYPGRFSFSVEVEPGLEHHAIPRLMLQPLVENALNHGVLSREYGVIHLKINRQEQYIHFELSDNGEGMDEQKIKEILTEKRQGRRQKSAVHSISIGNIRQRLNLIYKDDYVFEIRSRVGEGTTIYISVPMEYREKQKGEENEEKTEN